MTPERIAALEARLAQLEARVALLERGGMHGLMYQPTFELPPQTTGARPVWWDQWVCDDPRV